MPSLEMCDAKISPKIVILDVTVIPIEYKHQGCNVGWAWNMRGVFAERHQNYEAFTGDQNFLLFVYMFWASRSN